MALNSLRYNMVNLPLVSYLVWPSSPVAELN